MINKAAIEKEKSPKKITDSTVPIDVDDAENSTKEVIEESTKEDSTGNAIEDTTRNSIKDSTGNAKEVATGTVIADATGNILDDATEGTMDGTTETSTYDNKEDGKGTSTEDIIKYTVSTDTTPHITADTTNDADSWNRFRGITERHAKIVGTLYYNMVLKITL